VYKGSTYLIPTSLLLLLLSSFYTLYTVYSESTNTCTLKLVPGNFTSGITGAPNDSVVCLLPGVYSVNGDVNIANKSLILQGLGSSASDVKIMLSGGSFKLAPSENDTIVLRNMYIESLTKNPAIQIYWSGRKGVRYDIGSVLLENLVVNATQAIATSVQVGPDVKLRSFELRGSLVLAGETGVQIGPNSTATGVIIIKDNTIHAGKIGIQVGPDTQVAEYLEISHNNIEASVIGIQIGPSRENAKAPPAIGKLVVVGNKVISNSSNVLEVRSIVKEYAYIYLNIFMGDGSKASLKIDPDLIPVDKIVFNTPEKVTYFYNGRMFTNYLGNYYVDWVKPDNDGDGIVDYPREIVGVYRDSYSLADPSILHYLTQTQLEKPDEEIYIAMGSGILTDLTIQSYIVLALAIILLMVASMFKPVKTTLQQACF